MAIIQNKFGKFTKADKKSLYTWIGCVFAFVLVCAMLFTMLTEGSNDEKDFGQIGRGLDLADMPFDTDAMEQELLSGEYSDISENPILNPLLYSPEEKALRQYEDEEQDLGPLGALPPDQEYADAEREQAERAERGAVREEKLADARASYQRATGIKKDVAPTQVRNLSGGGGGFGGRGSITGGGFNRYNTGPGDSGRQNIDNKLSGGAKPGSRAGRAMSGLMAANLAAKKDDGTDAAKEGMLDPFYGGKEEGNPEEDPDYVPEINDLGNIQRAVKSNVNQELNKPEKKDKKREPPCPCTGKDTFKVKGGCLFGGLVGPMALELGGMFAQDFLPLLIGGSDYTKEESQQRGQLKDERKEYEKYFKDNKCKNDPNCSVTVYQNNEPVIMTKKDLEDKIASLNEQRDNVGSAAARQAKIDKAIADRCAENQSFVTEYEGKAKAGVDGAADMARLYMEKVKDCKAEVTKSFANADSASKKDENNAKKQETLGDTAAKGTSNAFSTSAENLRKMYTGGPNGKC